MKKMMFLLMMICLSANSWAQTASGNCGLEDAEAVIWEYDATTTTLSIYGIGKMADYNSGNAPWNAYISSITSVVIESGVTSIGSSAFSGCSKLTSVSIPNGVTTIGESTFSVCSGLTSVSIPIGVTSIGNSAFSGCLGLTSVSIPNGVTSIGNSSFSGCSGLTSVSLPNGVTTIGESTFSGCSGLTSVSLPNSVTSIGNSAFSGCSKLTSVSIPSCVTSIGNSAFQGCSVLTDVYYNKTAPIVYSTDWQLGSTANPARTLHIPSGATDAFNNNGWTTTVFASISQGFPSGKYVTEGSDLSWVLVDHTLTIFGTGKIADYNSGNDPWSAYHSSITSVVIESGVTSIGNSAFSGFSALMSISIPVSVTIIGEAAFSGCSALTSVSIPNNLSSINNNTFNNCSSLTSVSIPNSVISIARYAFAGCSSLTSVSIPNNITSIEDAVFEGCSGLTTITVGADNTAYRSTDKEGKQCNALLTYDGKNLIKGCNNTTIPSDVTIIGGAAFTNCSALTSITIPNSLTELSSTTFAGCSALTDVYYASTNPTAYISNWNLGSTANPARTLHIPSGATDAFNKNGWTTTVFASISDDIPAGNCGALNSNVSWMLLNNTLTISGTGKIANYNSGNAPWSAYRSSITRVVIESGVTSIGNSAFSGLSALTSVSIPESVTDIGESAFSRSGLASVNIPENVTDIGAYAFQSCLVTSVNIPKNVTNIKSGAFNMCFMLETITVDAVNTAYRSTDANGNQCNALLSEDGKTLITGCKNTTIPSDVTTIVESAFSACSGLTSVSIPGSVTSIEDDVFTYCSKITTITVDAGNTAYRSTDANGNQCNALLSKDGKTLIAGCKNTTIPTGVTSIGTNAFNGCSGLTSVSIPDGVTSIGTNAFSGCSKLASVIIPSGVTSIGDYAFDGCSGLTSVSIPGSVTSIGDYTFWGCSALANVYYNKTSPIDYNADWNLGSIANPARTLHVPVGATTDAFSGWASDFAAVKYDIVDVTVKTGLVYTGSEQTGVQAATGYNTVTDGAKTDAGNYTATASLTNPSIHVWPDGTTANKTIAWSIAQATNAWTTEPSIADYAYGATPSTPAAGAKSSETPEIGYYTEETCTNAVDLTTGKPAPGTYYMKASLAGTGNYTALSKVVAFHITNQIVTLNETGTDNGLTGKDAVKSNVTYARTFTAGNWSTICLPFALTQSQMDAAFGSSYEVAKLESVSSGVLSFTKVTDMAAGTPYIIKFTSTAPTTLTFKDVIIDKTDCSFSVGAGETCTMTGTSAVTTITKDENHYIMQGNKIYRVATDNVKMAAFRAYLTYSESNGSPAKAGALTFDVDGETTGIAGVGVDSSNVNDAWYTLGGQKLSKKPTANGIYISNGHKIIIK